MNANIQIKAKHFFEQTAGWSFLLMMLSFPLSLFVNNLFATVFLIAFGLYLVLNKTFFVRGANSVSSIYFLVFSLPFLLTLTGSLYTSNISGALNLIEKTAPVLFFAFYAVYHHQWFENKIKKALWLLVVGCLLSATISWGLSLYEIYNLNLSTKVLFTQEFAYHNLAEKLGVHTPYLALFINTSLGFIVYSFYDKNTTVSKIWLWTIFIVLSVFLFNLMARNAIFCYLLFGLIFLIKSKQYLLLLAFSLLFISLIGYIYSTEKNFLRDRFIYGVNLFEEQTIFSKKDNRFDRWGASITIFKEHPIIGVGTGAISEHRKEKYLINLDSEAFNRNYNAHNQFVEYLSTYGLIGGIGFLVLFFFMFKQAFQNSSYLPLYLCGCFFIATLTESILLRSWGLMYYGVLLIFLFAFQKRGNSEPYEK